MTFEGSATLSEEDESLDSGLALRMDVDDFIAFYNQFGEETKCACKDSANAGAGLMQL